MHAHKGSPHKMMKSLRVGVDLTGIWRRPTGIFRHAAEMAKRLLLLPEGETKVHYVFFFAREIHPDFVPLQHAFEAVICPMRNELFCKQCWFPLMLPRLHLNVIHYPAFPPPYVRLFGPRIVMTFHDTAPWRYPETLTWYGRFYFRTLLAHGARMSTQVTTPSVYTRSEVGHFLGKHYLPKISIVPGAVKTEFGVAVSDTCRQAVRARYQLPDTYILTVATVEPRKNLLTLLDAYTRLRQQSGQDCSPLVVVGRKGWNCSDILRRIELLQNSIYFLGHVPDPDLATLYQMARCFVFPSLYEGFGFPVLEAMIAGCPVITTAVSSLPEVAGNAALLVDPHDAAEMADAMRKVLQDEALRRRMIDDGRVQASRFSWEHTARLYREVYSECSPG